MAASLSQQTVSVKDTAAGRKRRRRAPAGGAAADCFTCSKRSVKCDRRRPYCSQCLEFGNECSGYKTQLTWGVGVASRGKLRGLSLPVARAPPVSRGPKKTPPVLSSQVLSTAALTEAQWAEQREPQRHALHPHPDQHPQQQQQPQQHSQQQPHTPMEISSLGRSASTPANSYAEPGQYDYFAATAPHGTSPNDIQTSWDSIPYSSNLLHTPDPTPRYSRFSLPLDTDGLSSSVGSVSDVDYLSPHSHTYPRDDMSFGSASPIIFDGYAGSQHSSMTPSPPLEILLGHHPHTRVPNPCPALLYAASDHSSNLDSHPDPFEAHLSHKLMRECHCLGENPVVPCTAFPF
ncbi:hypothetical protein E4U42_002981 [Claviceps africana]|uniref:Zn(2)-C6 fungal-type domain-containing protein n=1 Tax=Claviceps africana TaxID=83212 RepID=A0A8K0J830_9HYPO|nr:hypothetical protein E4U42_002981 [Claviceps africana]